MRGNRVVDLGFDALLEQPASQAIALRVTNTKNVKDIPLIVSQTRELQACGQVFQVKLSQLALVLDNAL